MRTKRFFSVVFVSVFMCLCMLFAGCTPKEQEVKVEGTYKFKSLTHTENGVSSEYKLGDEYEGVMLNEDFMIATFEESGVATMTLYGRTVNGTWKKIDEKDKIEMIVENEPEIFVCDGKILIIDETIAGIKIVLEKK